MKLKHTRTGQTITVADEHDPDRYLSQGWVPVDHGPGISDAPKGNASLAAWQDYARSKGYTDADLDGMTRADLRAALS